MSHTLNIGEAAIVRREDVTVQRFLSYVPKTVVLTATVTAVQRDTRNLNVYAITVSVTSGSVAAALPGYTAFIGSVAGARDLSALRIRKPGSGSTLYVMESALGYTRLEVGAHVTVVAYRKPWPKLPRLIGITDSSGATIDFFEFHDYDVLYSDQNTAQQPLANVTRDALKPVLHAGWLDTGQSYRTVQLDSSQSKALTGSIASRTWSVNSQTITVGSTSTTAITVRFAEGFHWCSLTITTNQGKSATHWFPIWAHGNSYRPISDVQVTRDERAEWREQDLEVFNAPGLSEQLWPGSTLCSWEVTYYGDDEAPYQRPTQTVGWSPAATAKLKAYDDAWELRLVGAGGWLTALQGYGQLILKPDGGVVNEWNEMANGTVTVDRVVAYVAREYSNILELCNLYLLSGNTDVVEEEEIKLGNQWEQLKYLISGYLGKLTADSGSAMWVTLQPFYGTQEDVDLWPTVLSLTPSDWTHEEGLTVIVEAEPTVNQLTMSGSFYDGNRSHELASVGPGDAMTGMGDTVEGPYQRLPPGPNPQATLNARCGYEWWRRANSLRPVSLQLFGDLDVVEPAWGEVVRLTWEIETAAGLEFVTKPFVVNEVQVEHQYEGEGEQRVVSWTLEAVTVGKPGTTVLMPEGLDFGYTEAPAQPPMLELPDFLPEDGLYANQQTAAAWPRGGTTFYRTGPEFNGSGLDTESPQWDPYDLFDSDAIDGELVDFQPDPSSPHYTDTGPELNGMLLTTSHAYFIEDVMGTPVVSAGHELPFGDDTTTVLRSITASSGIAGEFLIVGRDVQDDAVVYVSYTEDYGDTWLDSSVDTIDAISLEPCIPPIGFADLINGVGYNIISIPSGCGNLGVPTLTSGAGEGGAPALKRDVGIGRCCGMAISLIPEAGKTWNVTQASWRFKWDYGGGFSGLVFDMHVWTAGGVVEVIQNAPGYQYGYNDNAWHTITWTPTYNGDDVTAINLYCRSDSGASDYHQIMYCAGAEVLGTQYDSATGDPEVVEAGGLPHAGMYPGAWLSPRTPGKLLTSWPRLGSGNLTVALATSDDGGVTLEDLNGEEWAIMGAQEIRVPVMDSSEDNIYHGNAYCQPLDIAVGIAYSQAAGSADTSPTDSDGFPIGFTDESVHPLSISVVDGLVLLVCGCSRSVTGEPNGFGVYLSSDGGVGWTEILPLADRNVRSVAITRNNTHWFGWGAHGFVGVSSDGGTDLLDKTGNLPDILIARVVGG